MRGIVVAGGSGKRMYPVTIGVSKQLLPVFDKPMIYYPISVLMLAGIREILIIASPSDLSALQRLLGDGSQFGIDLKYEIQSSPEGIAQAFIIGEKFIDKDDVCLILGDNIFFGNNFATLLKDLSQETNGATIFGYRVKDPHRFGIVDFDKKGNVTSLEEKPLNPKSNCAITGLYFYDKNVVEIAKSIKPSNRGELEITSINQIYMDKKRLKVKILGRGFAWLDAGTFRSLLDASFFIETIENRQGYKIACLEEIAYNQDWISKNQVEKAADKLKQTSYGSYLISLISEKNEKI
tara:strand:+ start:276 stop:1157 length:882 start_codon:yes stop_codon:yes gene_type:complete